jgi:hypothetical protein
MPRLERGAVAVVYYTVCMLRFTDRISAWRTRGHENDRATDRRFVRAL